jgi:hypothetical protein
MSSSSVSWTLRRTCRVTGWVIAVLTSASLLGANGQAPEAGRAIGTLSIDGTAVTMSFAVRTTRQNAFDDLAQDPVVVVSNVQLTAAEASDEAALFARAQRGELVSMALRFDGRPGRGKLFNVAISHAGASDIVRLPDLWFQYTFKGGRGTLALEPREFNAHIYAGTVEFAVVMPVETAAATVPAAPATLRLPPPSKTDAERSAASALLIAALQEGDEQRALAIVALGIDPNARDQKMGIPLINWAVLMCQPPIVEALVTLKADVTHQRLPGMTLLSEAQAACPDAVPFLRAAGAKQ